VADNCNKKHHRDGFKVKDKPFSKGKEKKKEQVERFLLFISTHIICGRYFRQPWAQTTSAFQSQGA